MLRKLRPLALSFLLSACASTSVDRLITVQMEGYPHPSAEDRKGLTEMLMEANLPPEKSWNLYDLVLKAAL